MQGWIAGVPKRNLLGILGDFNASLHPQHPHVGFGVGHSHLHKKDGQALQSLIQTAGLNAVNTWGKPGQKASTFWTHRGEGSQIDFILVRNPCNLSRIRSATLPQAPIVHPTGFRHVPVQCFLDWPSPPRTKLSQGTTAFQVARVCNRSPQVLEQFRSRLQQVCCTAEQLDSQLQEVWEQRRPAKATLPIVSSQTGSICLKNFWSAKRRLKALVGSPVDHYVLLIPEHTDHSPQLSSSTRQYLQHLLQCWHATAGFQRLNVALRKRSQQARTDKIEGQIQDALNADQKGLTHLYKCMNMMRPKNPKRTIHIKSAEGRLQSNASELATITDYFNHVFESSEPPVLPQRHLQSALDITKPEIRQAIESLSSKKALPQHQAPAALWKAGAEVVVEALHADFQKRFAPGEISMPADWLTSHVVLIPKPGKAPTSPANLRPISLLPAVPKLLARIAAQRLRPYLLHAVKHVPQFAYIHNRQTSDSIDRVISHCHQVRSRVAENRFNPFKQSHIRARFTGGMQLSLDLAKAFDKMPRHSLLTALERISLPEDLISLILYIHDNAIMSFSRGNETAFVRTGSGVRQGCGLAPLLWVAYTLLLFDKFTQYPPISQITGFADDLHMHWTLEEPRHFRNACAQVGFIITDLADMGMQVSTDKTVILLALAGPSYDKVTAPFVQKRKKERFLKVMTSHGPAQLPIKNSHSYLGIKISYQHFERLTMQYRLQQSWQAFHRLSGFLCSKQLSLQQRLRLWRTCAQSIARYGLDAVGLDEVSASKYRAHTARQLRRIAGSPAHLTHETNQELHARLKVPDPVVSLCDHVGARVQKARQHLSHLHPPLVAQWLVLLVSETALYKGIPVHQRSELTEITQVARIACSCNTCGQQFASFHALRTHIGKRHPEQSIAQTHASYAQRAERRDTHLKFARGGLPQCNQCLKKFSGWPAFMTHFNQRACPVLHVPEREPEHNAPGTEPPPDVTSACGAFEPGGTLGDALAEEPVPVFQMSSTASVAKTGKVSLIAKHLRDHGRSDRCPECGIHCKPMYITRHACKQHSWLQQAHAQVLEWAKNCQVPSNPCQWCGTQFSTSSKAHRNACPILWACGQLLVKYFTLTPSGQGALHGYGWKRGTSPGSRRAEQLRELHEAYSGHSSYDNSSQPSFDRHGCGPKLEEGGGCRDGHGGKKWQRGQGKGTQRLQGKQSQQQSWWDKDRDQRGYNKSNEDLKNVVKALGRLVLRQEDSLSVTQLDCQFVIFMKNKAEADQSANWSITGQLLSVGNHWRDRKAQSPKDLNQPLRTVLFSSWLTAIRFRIQEFTSNPSVKEQAIKMGILVEDSFPYMQWDPEASKHVQIPQDPLTVADALQTIEQLQKIIVHPNVIGRFHPLRKLTEGMVSDVIPWTLEIQNRTQEAQAAYALIGRLVRNGCTHLAASTLRPSKLGRSPLATAVDKMIQEL